MMTERRKGRLSREASTLRAMVNLYCGSHHSGQPRCAQCEEILAYALKKLEGCKFGSQKPVCSKCPVHCYKPDMRESIRSVMRFSGPRMTTRHPLLALMHMFDSRRKTPVRRK